MLAASAAGCTPPDPLFWQRGAIPGGDMTFEAALTKLMILAVHHEPDDVRRLMQQDLAGELTV